MCNEAQVQRQTPTGSVLYFILLVLIRLQAVEATSKKKWIYFLLRSSKSCELHHKLSLNFHISRLGATQCWKILKGTLHCLEGTCCLLLLIPQKLCHILHYLTLCCSHIATQLRFKTVETSNVWRIVSNHDTHTHTHPAMLLLPILGIWNLRCSGGLGWRNVCTQVGENLSVGSKLERGHKYRT